MILFFVSNINGILHTIAIAAVINSTYFGNSKNTVRSKNNIKTVFTIFDPTGILYQAFRAKITLKRKKTVYDTQN